MSAQERGRTLASLQEHGPPADPPQAYCSYLHLGLTNPSNPSNPFKHPQKRCRLRALTSSPFLIRSA